MNNDVTRANGQPRKSMDTIWRTSMISTGRSIGVVSLLLLLGALISTYFLDTTFGLVVVQQSKTTGGTHKGKQEVESKKGELGSRLRLGDEVQEPNVRKQRNCEELRGNGFVSQYLVP
ncbi:hypothetical protein F3Y22_tig00000916pilonHSYRG00290 [Hibiscus syriacus]|uniref:Uncharacterized protein n=1 Tax=Hibiscus syriacus TaxID=106335 RepID=A0A6A3CWG2_HIBSY|nr:uncharacterized protein LOC120117963 [Hibiscus syriacus]KAE8733925.1 hypothetical protein F3Y22_tig00000916pilonHSYRG00290 [Hibiscus syriacus]